ncbi:hypothetical protein ACSDBR_01570 [Acidithiobacillus ferriphilus]|uniref:hypothetical protein n=1 Tax=Acidithiobacillus ferriphilus TaxID=1689834 RepID=UPI003F51A4E8
MNNSASLILRARGYARTCATKKDARRLERLADRLEAILDAQRRECLRVVREWPKEAGDASRRS